MATYQYDDSMTITQLLAVQNELAEALGGDEVARKSWKEGKPALISELDRMAEARRAQWTVRQPGKYNTNLKDPIGTVEVEHSTYRGQEYVGNFDLVQGYRPYESGARDGYAGYITIQGVFPDIGPEQRKIKVRVRGEDDGYTAVLNDVDEGDEQAAA